LIHIEPPDNYFKDMKSLHMKGRQKGDTNKNNHTEMTLDVAAIGLIFNGKRVGLYMYDGKEWSMEYGNKTVHV